MDAARFEALARSFGDRRAMIRGVAGGALAALLTRFAIEGAAARCRKIGKPCEKGDKCCNGGRCGGGRCRCRSGAAR